MALIGDIRKNSWLLIILIGLALAAFILMDMFSGEKSIFGSQQFNIGNINGKNISWNDFQRTESILYNNSGADPYNRRQALWNYYVEESLLQEEAEALGLSVGRDELMDLQFGAQPSPIIQQSFRNPQTGQLDRASLNEFKKRIEDNSIAGPQRQYWAVQEKQIVKDRLQSKLGAMVTKGMYTPTWMVEQTHADQNQKLDFNYVKIPFDEIADSDIQVTDSDLNTYLASNAAMYSQDEETRKVDYVSFEVKPTAADSAAIRDELSDLKQRFQDVSDDELADFVSANLGLYNDAYYEKDKLGPNSQDGIFNAAIGSIVGPYIEGTTYTMAKVLDRRVLPDSAKSRHILISATTEDQFVQAEKTIDSLKNLIQTGASQFDSLAIKFSQDPGSASKGGVYDNVGINQFVPEYRDIIFYKGQRGKLYSVRTSYGVHLIEPMGRTPGNNKEYVKVAYLSQPIIPSEETQDDIYDKVYQIVNDNRTIDALRTAASAEGLSIESSPPYKKNDYIVGTLGGGQASRDIVKWSFENNNIGEVSPEVYRYQDPTNYHYNKYVATALKSVQGAGTPSLANIRDEIMPVVLNQKKAEMLKSKISGQNLTNVASTYGTEVDNVTGASFNSSFLAGLGNEPKVVASAFNLKQGEVSAPIAGDGGVYIVEVTNKTAAAAAANIPQLRKTATSEISRSVQANLMKSIKGNAQIEDNRSNFY